MAACGCEWLTVAAVKEANFPHMPLHLVISANLEKKQVCRGSVFFQDW